MNLTNTLKRIDVFLGATDAALEEYHIEQAVAALEGICDDLEKEALPEPVSANTGDTLVKKINDAINKFLRTPEIERMTRKVQTKAFKQVAAHYVMAGRTWCSGCMSRLYWYLRWVSLPFSRWQKVQFMQI